MKARFASAILFASLIPTPLFAAPTTCNQAQIKGNYDFHNLNFIYKVCSGTVGTPNPTSITFRCLDNLGRASIWAGSVVVRSNCRLSGNFTGTWASGAPGSTPMTISGGVINQTRQSFAIRSFETFGPTPTQYKHFEGIRTPTVLTVESTAESASVPLTFEGPKF